MYSTESPEIDYDAKGYSIPERFEELYVGQKLLLSQEKEIAIRKVLVRQEINVQVGDSQDLIADMSNALTAMIKQINGETLTEDDKSDISKYLERQNVINTILASDYK
jgi:hypothetical protein